MKSARLKIVLHLCLIVATVGLVYLYLIADKLYVDSILTINGDRYIQKDFFGHYSKPVKAYFELAGNSFSRFPTGYPLFILYAFYTFGLMVLTEGKLRAGRLLKIGLLLLLTAVFFIATIELECSGYVYVLVFPAAYLALQIVAKLFFKDGIPIGFAFVLTIAIYLLMVLVDWFAHYESARGTEINITDKSLLPVYIYLLFLLRTGIARLWNRWRKSMAV